MGSEVTCAEEQMGDDGHPESGLAKGTFMTSPTTTLLCTLLRMVFVSRQSQTAHIFFAGLSAHVTVSDMAAFELEIIFAGYERASSSEGMQAFLSRIPSHAGSIFCHHGSSLHLYLRIEGPVLTQSH